MDWKRDRPLADGQTAHPVLWRELVRETWLSSSTVSLILSGAFGRGRGRSLKTWERDKVAPDGPHWIGVRGGTPLHTDPRYPRYTHQWVIHNGGWFVGGVGCEVDDDPFVPGTFFCLDTHSPHILVPDPRIGAGSFYLAVSVDSPTRLDREAVLPAMREFLGRTRR